MLQLMKDSGIGYWPKAALEVVIVLLLNLLRMNNLAERIGYGDGDKVDFGPTLAFRRSTARRSNLRASIRRRRAAAAR